jgi:hypothetical protein
LAENSLMLFDSALDKVAIPYSLHQYFFVTVSIEYYAILKYDMHFGVFLQQMGQRSLEETALATNVFISCIAPK